eukprot:TRINITY_DN23333_c0_g1_i1.p1 TRINITY_DN23333_c0_g1~~TRINITY_DN23333_c0_g1_i1.p1  ORF type:complete len:246 (+),score=24.28 TRINITY_DN23333_c0_g1_i1:39-776(+)
MDNAKLRDFCEAQKLVVELWGIGRRLAFLSLLWGRNAESELHEILDNDFESLSNKWGQPTGKSASVDDTFQKCGAFLFKQASLVVSDTQTCIQRILEGCQLHFRVIEKSPTTERWEELAKELASFKALLETHKAERVYHHIVSALETLCRTQKMCCLSGLQSLSASLTTIANTKVLTPRSAPASVGVIEFDAFFATDFQLTCTEIEAGLQIEKSPFSVKQPFLVRPVHVLTWGYSVVKNIVTTSG